MDCVEGEVNTRVFGRCLSVEDSEGREWCLKQLLFANDRVLVVQLRTEQTATPHLPATFFRP